MFHQNQVLITFDCFKFKNFKVSCKNIYKLYRDEYICKSESIVLNLKYQCAVVILYECRLLKLKDFYCMFLEYFNHN